MLGVINDILVKGIGLRERVERYLLYSAALLGKAVSGVGAEERAAGVGVAHGVDVRSRGVGRGCRERERRHFSRLISSPDIVSLHFIRIGCGECFGVTL